MSNTRSISEEMAHQLEEALQVAMSDKRDPERMRKAIEEMNRSREEMLQRVGIVEIAVELIRETRDRPREVLMSWD